MLNQTVIEIENKFYTKTLTYSDIEELAVERQRLKETLKKHEDLLAMILREQTIETSNMSFSEASHMLDIKVTDIYKYIY